MVELVAALQRDTAYLGVSGKPECGGDVVPDLERVSLPVVGDSPGFSATLAAQIRDIIKR